MNSTDIPRPVYAAAGAGELAYQQLRRLPEAAQRGTAVFAARAAAARQRATAGYRTLVTRGERVVADRIGVTTGHTDPAEAEVEVGPVRATERPGTGG